MWNGQFPEPALGRLDNVADYLEYLVEQGLVDDEAARSALEGANILREAILTEGQKQDPLNFP
jgi:hypothetical protein